MDLITNSTKFLDRLAGNTEHFRNAMTSAGFTISGDNHPICPVMLGDAKLATTFADKMMGTHIFLINYKIFKETKLSMIKYTAAIIALSKFTCSIVLHKKKFFLQKKEFTSLDLAIL